MLAFVRNVPWCDYRPNVYGHCILPYLDKAVSIPGSDDELTFYNSVKPIAEISLVDRGIYGSCMPQPYNTSQGLQTDNLIYFGCHHQTDENQHEPSCYTLYNKTAERFIKRASCSKYGFR